MGRFIVDSVKTMTQSTLATHIHQLKDKLVATSVPFLRCRWLEE